MKYNLRTQDLEFRLPHSSNVYKLETPMKVFKGTLVVHEKSTADSYNQFTVYSRAPSSYLQRQSEIAVEGNKHITDNLL